MSSQPDVIGDPKEILQQIEGDQEAEDTIKAAGYPFRLVRGKQVRIDMSNFEEVYNPDAPKASAEFDAWWKKDGDDALMNRTSGANFRYVYWMAHKAYDAGKEAARAEMASEAKLPHAGLEVMGNIEVDEGGQLQRYDRALVLTFNSTDEIRRAIAAEQCTFGFKE